MPFDDTVSSLSAIILNDGYFEFIKSNAVVHEGISLLMALHIIPLKMRAHIDNVRLHGEGVPISEKVLKKHRADVFELSRLLALDSRLPLEGGIRKDAEAFLRDFEEYAYRVTSRKRRADLIDALEFIRRVYL